MPSTKPSRASKPQPTQAAIHSWNDEAQAWCVLLCTTTTGDDEWVCEDYNPTTLHGRLFCAAFCAHPRDFRNVVMGACNKLLGWPATMKGAEAKAKRAAKAVNAELKAAARGEPPPSREVMALAAVLARG